MRVIIQSAYRLRDKLVTAYYAYPQFSLEIEEKMTSELTFLQKLKVPFSIELKIENKS
jgi:hypothetical protein